MSGTERNPDGKTQYRVKVEGGTRLLVSEQHLNVLIDTNQLVLVGRESELYRRSLTTRLRAVLPEDRFVAAIDKASASRQNRHNLNVRTSHPGKEAIIGGPGKLQPLSETEKNTSSRSSATKKRAA
ncbi:MAG: hypothetical protein IPK92_14795 [Nitrospira sp.]|nr:hypothetical protein [Nitrospira sp.]